MINISPLFIILYINVAICGEVAYVHSGYVSASGECSNYFFETFR